MEIRCSLHTQQKAAYLCNECGFLCKQHEAEETSKDHSLQTITSSFTNLYSQLLNQRKTKIWMASITEIKHKLNYLLDIMTSAESSKQSKSTMAASSPSILGNHIDKLVRKNDALLSQFLTNAIIDKQIIMLTTFKSEVNQVKESPAPSLEYFNKGQQNKQIFQKNQNFSIKEEEKHPSRDIHINPINITPDSAKKKYCDSEFPPTAGSLGINITKEYQWKRSNEIILNNCTILGQTSFGDVIQGELGDGYLMSALAGIAPHTEVIKSFFVKADFNPLGKYSIIMYLNGVKTIITIDDYFPCLPNTNIPAFAKPIKNQLWVMLLEKAWAKANVTYSDIISNNPGYPIKVFTGAPSFDFPHKELKTNNELWQSIINGLASKKSVSASVGSTSDTTGLAKNHFYTILMAKEVNVNRAKMKLLKIRNPWGVTEWKGKWSNNDTTSWTDSVKTQMGFVKTDDGTFHMSFEDFTNLYCSTTICNIHPSYTPKSITLGHKIGNYSACSITFPSAGSGYIYATYLDYRLRGSGVTKFEDFYVQAGIWKKLDNDEYKFISKINIKAPYIYLLKNENISRGEYLVVMECKCSKENVNKVVLRSYASVIAQMKEISLTEETIKKLMVATSAKSKKAEFKEDSNLYYLFNYFDAGISFCSYTLCNHTADKTISQVVKLSDASIKCFAPYDAKLGEFEITAPPNHDVTVVFKANIKEGDVATTLSLSFSYRVKGLDVDPITLISPSTMKKQYCMAGTKVAAYNHMVGKDGDVYIIYVNDSDDIIIEVQSLTLKLINLKTSDGKTTYSFKVYPHRNKAIKMESIAMGKVSCFYSEKVDIFTMS